VTTTPVRPYEPALPDACRVTSAVHGDIPAFHIYGEVDHRAAAHVRTVLTRAVGERSMLLDLSGVVFVDHAGLEAVMCAICRAEEAGGCVALAITSPAILALLRARGLSPRVHVTRSSLEGLGWLAASTRPSF
jgi:anti-anti-sigma factor